MEEKKIHSGYEIEFLDDKGNPVSLFTENEEVIRALVHNGYRITIQHTYRTSRRMDAVDRESIAYREQNDRVIHEQRSMAMSARNELVHDPSPIPAPREPREYTTAPGR